MKSQRIADHPNLAPVFGTLDVALRQRVDAELQRAEEWLVALRDALAARSSKRWETAGLELHTLPSGQAYIDGYVDSGELAFIVQLRPWNFFDGGPWYPGEEPRVMAHDAWGVEASVEVVSDAETDEGFRPVMEISAGRHDEPAAASAALADVVSRLQKVALSRPAEAQAWRSAAGR